MMCTIFLLFFNCTATTEISPYGHTLSLRDALPIYLGHRHVGVLAGERAPVHEVPERDGPPSVLSEAEISHARNLSGAGQEARRRCRRMRRRSFSVAPRSEERRVGQGCVRTCRSSWSPEPSKKRYTTRLMEEK